MKLDFQTIKEAIEFLYLLSGVILVIGVGIAIKQLTLLKHDIKSRNKRASVEKTIEYLNWFATEFIPQTDEYRRKLSGGEVVVFPSLENRPFIFDNKVSIEDDRIKQSLKLKYDNGCSDLNNQLEFFSAAMISGLADEELAFNPLAKAFCEYVEFQYDTYCYSRRDGNERLFSHTIELYNLWKDKLESLDLQKQKEEIEERMSGLKPKAVGIIGNE